jgi:hypothetical protein
MVKKMVKKMRKEMMKNKKADRFLSNVKKEDIKKEREFVENVVMVKAMDVVEVVGDLKLSSYSEYFDLMCYILENGTYDLWEYVWKGKGKIPSGKGGYNEDGITRKVIRVACPNVATFFIDPDGEFLVYSHKDYLLMRLRNKKTKTDNLINSIEEFCKKNNMTMSCSLLTEEEDEGLCTLVLAWYHNEKTVMNIDIDDMGKGTFPFTLNINLRDCPKKINLEERYGGLENIEVNSSHSLSFTVTLDDNTSDGKYLTMKDMFALMSSLLCELGVTDKSILNN